MRAAVMIFAGLLAGCAPEAPEPPPGAVLAGDAAAAGALLGPLESWSGTRVSRWAGEESGRIAACGGRFTRVTPGEGQPQLRCEELADFASFSGGHPLVFALPEGPAGRLVGWIDPGESLQVGAELRRAREAGAWGLVLPEARGPGPFVLSDAGALAHGRVRAARIAALTELVESGSQGDAMFGLKSELFTGSILDGTWEFALYLPEDGGLVPRVAMAIGVRSEDLARTALRAYIAQVEKTWKISFTDDIPGMEGCFEQVNMLPDLAPCGAIERGSVLLGWNRPSLEQARRAPDGAPLETALLRVSMERFPEADRLLSLAFAPEETPPAVPYPWKTLELRAWRDETGVHLSGEAR